MRTSARNRFEGTVAEVRPGAVKDDVGVTLDSGDAATAIITKNSTARLGIVPGRRVLALIKASFVVLLADEEGWVFSTRNVFPAVVTDVRRGQVACEVDMETTAGLSLTSTITVVSADRLGLEKGTKISAAVKASQVILAAKAEG